MKVCIPVTATGQVDHRFGRARRIAVGCVENGEISDWAEYDVGWDVLHDQDGHGAHHARVVRFLQQHEVEMVLVDHVGEGMRRMLDSMGVRLQAPVGEDARAAAAGS